MNKKIAIGIGAVVVLAIAWFVIFNRKPKLTDEIQNRLVSQSEESQLKVGDLLLKSSEEIAVFYAERDYSEAWSTNGKPNRSAREFITEIANSKYDGLNPEDYHASEIEQYSKKISDKLVKTAISSSLVDFDLLLTDAFFQLAKDLEIGKVDPTSLQTGWELELDSSKINRPELLGESLSNGSIKEGLESLYPTFDSYKKAREIIRDLEEKAKGDSLEWKTVTLKESLKKGDSHQSIPRFRERLIFWEFLKPYDFKDELVFDDAMEESLRKYQEANGMEPDGAIGDLTAESLNNSPNKLIDIASVNLERMRWLTDSLFDSELIFVNVANYQLDYLNKRDTLLSAKVIVGKEYNESTVFAAPMSYIVFSPYWNIPESIAQEEIIPAVRKNSKYLEEKNMEVVTTSGEPVKAKSSDWSSDPFPYLIRQKPGGTNSLGLVKFMFPNEHNIYIHDTPARSLFDRENRALSHGCIRIQNPEKFAAYLLEDDPSWTLEKIQEAMNQENEEIVQLKKNIPVVIYYLTFWADSDGNPQFRSDIYDRDREVLAALRN